VYQTGVNAPSAASLPHQMDRKKPCHSVKLSAGNLLKKDNTRIVFATIGPGCASAKVL
jgi:hypothetical protein